MRFLTGFTPPDGSFDDDPAALQRLRDGLSSAVDLKLVVDAGQMALHRAVADAQLPSCLAIRHPSGNQAEDIDLTRRQGFDLVRSAGRPPARCLLHHGRRCAPPQSARRHWRP